MTIMKWSSKIETSKHFHQRLRGISNEKSNFFVVDVQLDRFFNYVKSLCIICFKNFREGSSEYWPGSTNGYTNIGGHTYFTGSYWDGIVNNKTWTYIDYELSNNYTATFETLLTSPQVKPWYVNEMNLTLSNLRHQFIHT